MNQQTRATSINSLGITHITFLVINKDAKEVSFDIQTITEVKLNNNDQAEILLKTLRVTQKLSKDML